VRTNLIYRVLHNNKSVVASTNKEKGEMQYFPKEKVVTVVVFLCLTLFAVIFLGAPRTITNVSALDTEKVGVYWHSNCADTDRVFLIDWGTLNPGSIESIVVYIRNEVEEPIFLIMSPKNWAPSNASNYMTLRWDYNGRQVDPGEVLQIKLILFISAQIKGISNFSFDIYITGGQRLLGDVNGDGRVSSSDLILVFVNLGKSSEEFPGGDVNGDGRVSSSDAILVIINLGAGS